MGVDGCVPGSSSQVLAITVGDVLSSLGVAEALGQTEVDNVNVMLLLANSDQKVIRLDISMQEMARVNEFNSLKHLIGQHEDGLQGELAFAIVKQVFERGAQQVNNHDVVVSFNAKPVNIRHTNSTLQDTVELGLVEQLRMLGADGFQLDSNLLVGSDVSSVVDVSEGSTAQFT